MSGGRLVGWSGGRVSFWHWFCTVLAPFLALVLYCSGTVLALALALRHSVYALVLARVVRVPWVDPAPVPRVHPATTPPRTRTPSTSVLAASRVSRRPWGSLLAAPVAILLRHVTWPYTWPALAPLIGTLCLPPGVTQYWPVRAITANSSLSIQASGHNGQSVNKTAG